MKLLYNIDASGESGHVFAIIICDLDISQFSHLIINYDTRGLNIARGSLSPMSRAQISFCLKYIWTLFLCFIYEEFLIQSNLRDIGTGRELFNNQMTGADTLECH